MYIILMDTYSYLHVCRSDDKVADDTKRGRKQKNSKFWAKDTEGLDTADDLGVLVCNLSPNPSPTNINTTDIDIIETIDPLSVDSLGVLVCPLPQKSQKIDTNSDIGDKLKKEEDK
jgi:hypothetical protein